uniref:Uncharacterized protein n=1 Tax=Arundo donax TaxID=35708 RepID=A0A0A8ZYY6_ARUDO
MGMYNLWD